MPDYRRGRAAIETAATRKQGGFRPFVPEISWRDDGEKKYVLILTPIDQVGTFELHEWIPTGKIEKANGDSYTNYEAFLSRKDPFIGEDYDDLSDRLGAVSKTRCMGVAVELEPVVETVKGRKRPTGFTVKTRTFTRKTDDGEVEAEAPEIGLITQSAALMWNPLSSTDDSQGPLSELPIEIIRRGKDTGTRYDFVAFQDTPINLGPLLDNVGSINYLGDDLEALVEALSKTDSDIAAAQAIAEALFDKRVTELADKERYDGFVGPIEELKVRYPSDKKGGATKKPAPKPEAAAEPEAETVTATAVAEEPSRTDRFRALREQIENSQKSQG